MSELILASASPRRADLLRQIGIESFIVLPADIDEVPLKNETPKDLVLRLSKKKAEKLSLKNPSFFVLAADSIVVVGRRILGKPASKEEALTFLNLLSGRRHRVYTGLCVCTPDQKLISRTIMTQISFKRLTDEEKSWYLASGEWEGKAGGYAIQGKAARFIPWVNGCVYNVMGLPVHEVYKVLMGVGFFR